MQIQPSMAIAALVFAFPLSAQRTEGQEAKPETQKLWKIETVGISG